MIDPILSHALFGLACMLVTAYFSGGTATPESTPAAAPTTSGFGGAFLQGAEQVAIDLFRNALNKQVLSHASDQHAINQAQVPAQTQPTTK